MAAPVEKVNLKVEQGRATRRSLLDAARRVFAARGYDQVSAEQLVAEAGVTRGALYHHFDDKRDLFRALVVEVEEELDVLIQGEAAQADTPWGAIERGVDAAMGACQRPDVGRLVMLEAPKVLGWDEWEALDAEFGLKQARLGLEALQADGVVGPQPIEPLARMVISLINGACREVARSDDPAATAAQLRPVVLQLLGGMRSDR